MQFDDDHILLCEKARKLYDDHERRGVIFGVILVTDYAWQLLLSMFVQASHHPEKVTFIYRKSEAISVLRQRWMRVLADEGLTTRSNGDQPVTLSQEGYDKMVIYLRSI